MNHVKRALVEWQVLRDIEYLEMHIFGQRHAAMDRC
jgi:hypothetical protein